MARRKRPLPFIEKLEIVDVGAEGKAVGRYNERVVFVPFAATGDVTDVQVYKKRRSYYEARIVNFHKKSEYRVKPECSHFGLCGGCKWQHLDYRYQLAFKQKQVKDALDRIAKVQYPGVMPIIGSDKPYYYRNKLEFTFSDRRWMTELDTSKEDGGPEIMAGLGFHLPGMFDKILDIELCYLQKDPSNDIRLEIKKYAIEHGLTFYNARSQKGFLRNLIIRSAVTGDLMVILVFGYDDPVIIPEMMNFVAERFPEITSLMYVVNEKKNDTISDLEIRLFRGYPFIMEEMPSPVEGDTPFRFKVGPVSFYQTNPEQAFRLYKTAFDFAGFQGDELVYDLYTGTGTIAAFIAKAVKNVIGVEYVEDAVRDAKENMQLNNIDNVEFYSGDLAKMLDETFFAAHGKPDIIVTDPPRSGMHRKVVRQILTAEPEKIVYFSCNPATQARDIALLDEKYEVKKVQPVDMFPQTHHVENVMLLEKK